MFPRKSFVVPLPDGRSLALGERTLVMGVLNVTPDSFAEQEHTLDPERAVEAALGLVAAGADLLDIGGESTRPGAAPLGAAEELARVLPVLDRLAGRLSVPISIDTYKAEVADAALARGVSLVNDVSGLRHDPALAGVVARRGAALVVTHSRGRFDQMYEKASYGGVMADVSEELEASLGRAVGAGVPRDRLLVDPGLGFAKRAEHTWEALADLPRLAALDRPILVGPSRKSFLTDALGDRAPSEREWGTAAAVALAVFLGAHIVRVHAVREMVDVVRVADRVRDSAIGR